MDKKILIAIAILITAGFAIRVYDLSYHSYWMDESYSVKSTMNMETNILPCLDSGISYLRHMPYSFVLYLFTRFGYDEFTTRLPSVIFGTLLIPIIFLYSRRLFKDDYVALIPAILITFSQFFIAWSRQARHYSLLVLLFFVSLYYLDMFMSRPDNVYDYLAVRGCESRLTRIMHFSLAYINYLFKLEQEDRLKIFMHKLPFNIEMTYQAYKSNLFDNSSIFTYLRRNRNLLYVAEEPSVKFKQFLRFFSLSEIYELQNHLRWRSAGV